LGVALTNQNLLFRHSNPGNPGWIEYIIWITKTFGRKGFKRMGKAYSFL
jgi:hypothetical protein